MFVLYNFIMITWDLGVLTILKTFAMLRSFVRYYTYKMTGIERRDSKKLGKKRRRKEWREEVDGATSYKEYCAIELYEPQQLQVAATKPAYLRRTVSTSGGMNNSPSKPSGFGLRRRNTSAKSNVGSQTQEVVQSQLPPRSPVKSSIDASQSSSPGSSMRKIQSCLDLNNSPSNKQNRSRGSVCRTSPRNTTSVKRTLSTASLPNSNDDEDSDDEYVESDENCPKWQTVVKEDLGMAGDMLLTTMARLKEARMQYQNQTSGGGQFNDNSSNTSNSENRYGNIEVDDSVQSVLNDDGNANDNPTRDPSFHITSFSSNNLPKRKRINEDCSSSLKFLLSGIVKRNHLSIDDFLINDARSVAERGQHSLRKETREAIDRYGEEVERCLEWVANGPVYLGGGEGDDTKMNNVESNCPREGILQTQQDELQKRYTLVKRMKQNMGHTALMLSGGGAQAMYHLGTIKALVESELYEHIHVISGTSGGSISAAMCAIKSPEELLRDVCVKTVSTDFLLTGEMKRKNIRWFPELIHMGTYWLKHRLLVDSTEFKRCCEFYYKDITFEEAFEMTGKHVCITVTASRASAGSGVQRLLLNHISTPNVTLASAVAASCALPGVMAPAKLMIKDGRGKQVPFEVDGVEWIDGSVQAGEGSIVISFTPCYSSDRVSHNTSSLC